jgi:tripeptidyl-peptidase-1
MTLTDVSVTKANDLLGASYQVYRHIETNETVIRTVGYALPAALHGHVLTVSPTTEFAFPSMQSQTLRERSGLAKLKSASGEPVTELSKRDFATTPMFLRWLYKTLNYKPIALGQNMLGIAGYGSQWPSPTDLDAFMFKYRADGVGATFRVRQVNNGGYDPSRPHYEANLNVQYAEAIAYPTPIIFYSTGPTPGPGGSIEWFLSWLRYILDQEDSNIPQTITTSYGYMEKDTSRGYAENVCNKFALLGLRGVSVLFASGDDGVGKGGCVTNDGSVQFIPHFPASCSW